MIQFPYGIADFRRIRRENLLYVDRTAHIHDVERLGSILVFLRPRRFGKSLWLQTLATYYDLRYSENFDEIFDGLAIGGDPTPRRNRYFVLQWNFSSVTASGSIREIAESLHKHVVLQAELFYADYAGHLEAPVKVGDNPDEVLGHLLGAVRKTPYKLYLLIDEYDNFVNEVMAKDVKTYRALSDNDGPFKELFKRVKAATEGQGLERIFVTGVSPVALNDLTSGFNTATDVSHKEPLATLCGFRDEEIADLLQRVAAERDLPQETIERAHLTMRTWYNGYRLTEEADEWVYNPTNALYFLRELHQTGKPPKSLQDENLRTDRGKLAFLARTVAGAGVIEQITESGDNAITAKLVESFSVADLTKRLGEDRGAIASMLYYMGLLTRTDVPFRLRIPNLVARKLFLDRLLEIYLPDHSYDARDLAMSFFQDGDLSPLLSFFEERFLPLLSNRDRGKAPKKPGKSGSGVNETVLKTLFLSILFADDYYRPFSEPELERGYADLCLLVREEMRRFQLLDLLFEFKIVRRAATDRKGRELRGMDEAELRKLPAVKKAFDEAREQAKRYRAALVRREGERNLRTYAVVVVGLERMLGEEVP